MFSKLKSLLDLISDIDRRLGLQKLIQYVILGLFIAAVINYKSIISTTIETYDAIYKEKHAKKLLLRDQLMEDLNPILYEIRAEVGADRVLYMEYHNSKENLVGIPFKYVDLVLVAQKYGTVDFDMVKFRDINSGIITDLYTSLKKGDIVINKGPKDYIFQRDFPGIAEFMGSGDYSSQQCFVNLPGVKTPIGLLIFEWMDDSPERNWNEVQKKAQAFIPRINALILSKTL